MAKIAGKLEIILKSSNIPIGTSAVRNNVPIKKIILLVKMI